MITKKKINQKDKRGFILDIFVGKPKDHCSLVSFKKDSVRGNHFHKKSIQYSFILEGKLLMITSRVNKNGKYLGRKNRKIVRKNDLITHKPFMAHAFKAKTNSKILAFADGLRGGKNYEKDTFRLKNKLI
jgi:dTDP-4-dehydrorhamnose 3,5-epimerase-like enzyme